MERISKELICQGMEHGLITFGMEDDLLAAHIGDFWFFVCIEIGKTENDFAKEELVQMIHEAVNEEPINGDDEDHAAECLYYKHFLEERISQMAEKGTRKAMFVLVEVIEREIAMHPFPSLMEAQSAMKKFLLEAFQLEDDEKGNEELARRMDEGECGMDETSAWANASRVGNCDWSIFKMAFDA